MKPQTILSLLGLLLLLAVPFSAPAQETATGHIVFYVA